MKKKFRFTAIATGDRHLTIEKIQDVILSSKCFLINHKMFSDLQLSMHIEIKEHRLLNFYHRLAKYIRFTQDDFEDYDVHSKKICLVYLNISFPKGVGKLKVKIPRVPG